MPRPSLERVAFLGRCPACGEGKLFVGILKTHEYCSHCNLHIAAGEQGDGPAFFGIVVIGTLATIGAALLEVLYEPNMWVHAAIWPVFIVVGSLYALRFAKAVILGLQYGARPDDFKQ